MTQRDTRDTRSQGSPGTKEGSEQVSEDRRASAGSPADNVPADRQVDAQGRGFRRSSDPQWTFAGENEVKEGGPSDPLSGFLDRKKAYIRSCTLMSDRFARVVLARSPKLVQWVLRIALNRPDLQLENVQIQKEIGSVGTHAITLDAYGEVMGWKENHNKEMVYVPVEKHNFEIQRRRQGAPPERLRWHQDMIDMDSLPAGEDFPFLPDVYITFLMEEFSKEEDQKDDRAAQKDEVVPKDDEILMTSRNTKKDAGLRIYLKKLNGKYRGENAFGYLMEDWNNPDPRTFHYYPLAKACWDCKYGKGVQMLSDYYDEDMERAAAEAAAKAAAKEAEKAKKAVAETRRKAAGSILTLMKKQDMTAEEALDYIDMDPAEREPYLKLLKQAPQNA